MANIFVNALSGLNAAQTRMDVAAQNIANAQTEGYRPMQVSQQALAGGGVTVSISEQGRARAAQEDSLGADLIESKTASFAYQANLFSVRIADKMQRDAIALLNDDRRRN